MRWAVWEPKSIMRSIYYYIYNKAFPSRLHFAFLLHFCFAYVTNNSDRIYFIIFSAHMRTPQHVRLIPLFVILFIVVAIPLTVFVAQQQQTIQQQAQSVSLPLLPTKWPYAVFQLGYF